MPEKLHQREMLMEKRARALALMLLCRRDDFSIEEGREDLGWDYLVRFRGKDKIAIREIGIKVHGAWSMATKAAADKAARPTVRRMKQYAPFTRPVCLFLFAMEDDKGWYTWIAEPTEATDAASALPCAAEPNCRSLGPKAWEKMIERVERWYDTLLTTLDANGSEKREGERKHAKT